MTIETWRGFNYSSYAHRMFDENKIVYSNLLSSVYGRGTAESMMFVY